jgi:hypothetical protein
MAPDFHEPLQVDLASGATPLFQSLLQKHVVMNRGRTHKTWFSS